MLAAHFAAQLAERPGPASESGQPILLVAHSGTSLAPPQPQGAPRSNLRPTVGNTGESSSGYSQSGRGNVPVTRTVGANGLNRVNAGTWRPAPRSDDVQRPSDWKLMLDGSDRGPGSASRGAGATRRPGSGGVASRPAGSGAMAGRAERQESTTAPNKGDEVQVTKDLDALKDALHRANMNTKHMPLKAGEKKGQERPIDVLLGKTANVEEVNEKDGTVKLNNADLGKVPIKALMGFAAYEPAAEKGNCFTTMWGCCADRKRAKKSISDPCMDAPTDKFKHLYRVDSGMNSKKILNTWGVLLNPVRGDMRRSLIEGDRRLAQIMKNASRWKRDTPMAMTKAHSNFTEELFRWQKVMMDDHMRLHKGVKDHFNTSLQFLKQIPPNTLYAPSAPDGTVSPTIDFGGRPLQPYSIDNAADVASAFAGPRSRGPWYPQDNRKSS